MNQMIPSYKLINVFILCYLCIQFLAGCDSNTDSNQESLGELIQANTGYKIYIFKGINMKNVNNLAMSDSVITNEDIVYYDWDQQEIALSEHMLKIYKLDPRFLYDPAKFVITLNEEKIAEGDIVNTHSPRIILTPVMYVLDKHMSPEDTENNDELIISFRPQHVWGEDVDNSQFIIYESEQVAQIEQYFLKLGKLRKSN